MNIENHVPLFTDTHLVISTYYTLYRKTFFHIYIKTVDACKDIHTFDSPRQAYITIGGRYNGYYDVGNIVFPLDAYLQHKNPIEKVTTVIVDKDFIENTHKDLEYLIELTKDWVEIKNIIKKYTNAFNIYILEYIIKCFLEGPGRKIDETESTMNLLIEQEPETLKKIATILEINKFAKD